MVPSILPPIELIEYLRSRSRMIRVGCRNLECIRVLNCPPLMRIFRDHYSSLIMLHSPLLNVKPTSTATNRETA